jgi:proline iminopeptidase
MPTAAVNGTELYYETVGEGPPCLVLNGWPGVDHAYLRPGLDRLGTALRLVYYDHRGNGGSRGAPPDDLTLELLADDAAGLAATLSEEPVLVLGHAHGASVAQEVALRHPERVAGLILVAATAGELGMLEDLADTLDEVPVPVEVEILQRVPPASDEEWAATMRGIAPYFFRRPDQVDPGAVLAGTTCNADAARRWMQSLSFWSAFDRLDTLSVPALVLAGRHDLIFGPAQAQRIARRVPNAELVVLEESGHLPWLDEPDAFVAAVQRWLGS